MKTEVTKKYKWGFTISEQELRRLAQMCQEQIGKQIKNSRIQLQATLRDGSIIESENIDDIVTLENSGLKRIYGVKLTYDDGKDNSDCKIVIELNDAEMHGNEWISIRTKVIGQDRDWAFVTASDIEERIKKIKSVSVGFVLDQKWMLIAITIISMGIFMALFLPTINHGSMVAVDKLETAYKNGEIGNPIEAMIFLERAKNQNANSIYFALLMVGAYTIPYLLTFGLGKILALIMPAYNFYWGDNMEFLDRRKSAQYIFWIVIVLGLLVSIAAGFILKLFH